ncbi:voltage-gated chloride channel family protein [Carnobacterium mobile]|uniref:voltage-gated chloride channel family protein n=1 Tax=Carnobacterium mobile TaxID=2750 RepID=UPI0005580981|nr:voltage-gated chloride channel family protein [Carnobacterium mobile]
MQKIVLIKNNVTAIALYSIKWILITGVLSLLIGSVTAFFLTSLTWVSKQQSAYSWLFYLLPFGGALISFFYKKMGKNAIQGNNLVIEQANGADEHIPLRLVPLTLFGTLMTHLLGGSAGREGTAVQMGGSIAEHVGQLLHLNKASRKIVIICGISGGFSAVFGTPLAGTVFGLEVLALGLIRHEALLPSFFSAYFSNLVVKGYGVSHIKYTMALAPAESSSLFFKLLVAGALFGLTGLIFSRSIVVIKKWYTKWMPEPVIRTFIGGTVVVLLALIINNRSYLGLSLPLLDQAFSGEAHPFDFLGKLVFTVFTLGAGYQGGEVTPLFVIGATLGSSLASLLYLPVGFLAGLGFIGVFTGATNTPIACFIMGIELFGSENAIYLFLICVISYICSGNSGIYSAQKVGIKKGVLFEAD